MVDKIKNTWNKQEIKNAIGQKLLGLFGVSIGRANKKQLYKAISLVVRDQIMKKWAESEETVHQTNGKKL
ncbi:MAG: glycogen phosphorylase, partial [Firmicutes bacterium]|nr:glycogen phosphorylase [Bacillota bacterium]